MTNKELVNKATYNFYADWQELQQAGKIPFLLYDGISAPNKNILTIKFYYNNKLKTNDKADDEIYCYLHFEKEKLGNPCWCTKLDFEGHWEKVTDMILKIRFRILFSICKLQDRINNYLTTWRGTGHVVSVLEAEIKDDGNLFIDFN